MKHSARALGELLYQLGREHGAAQEVLARDLGKQLAKAFDDGFVLGRETGLRDAADAPPTDPSLLS